MLFEKRKLQHFIKFMDFLLFRTYDEVFCGISFKHIHELHFFRHERCVGELRSTFRKRKHPFRKAE